MSWTRRAFIATGLAAVATGAYAGIIEPKLRLRQVHYRFGPDNPLRGWPAGQKLRIAAMADPHVNRPFTPPSRIARIVAQINEAKPDVVVLLGDYTSNIPGTERSVEPDEVGDVLSSLRAPLGTYAVLGNHDWWDDRRGRRQIGDNDTLIGNTLAAHGITVMENDAIPLTHNNGKFWLLGLGDQWAYRLSKREFQGRDDLPGTLAQISDDAPAILLAHEPDIFPDVPGRVSLTLCGHTHGGQIQFFGWAPKVPSKFGSRYRYGHIIEDNRHLIVSSGVGCSSLPIRFGAPPEIVLIDIA